MNGTDISALTENPERASTQPTRLAHMFVCRTCPRPGETRHGRPGAGTGLRLASALEARLAGEDAIALRRVECLSGCRNPCNVRLACPGKPSLTFHVLDLQDVDDLASFARHYAAAGDDSTAASLVPGPLAARISSRIPSRVLQNDNQRQRIGK